jgi:hypothetical protein
MQLDAPPRQPRHPQGTTSSAPPPTQAQLHPALRGVLHAVQDITAPALPPGEQGFGGGRAAPPCEATTGNRRQALADDVGQRCIACACRRWIWAHQRRAGGAGPRRRP